MSQPQPLPYFPPPIRKHSHGGFIVAIVILAVLIPVAFFAGFGFSGVSVFNPANAPGFTKLSGSVTMTNNPSDLYFSTSAQASNIRATIATDGAYSATLVSNILYRVYCDYSSGSSQPAYPSSIAPTGSTEQQDFSC